MTTTVPLDPAAVAEFVATANEMVHRDHVKWHEFVNERKFTIDREAPMNEMSDAFLEFQLDIWRAVSGRQVNNPYVNERNENLVAVRSIGDMYPFTSRTPHEIANYFIAVAHILKKLDTCPPAAILEFGPGWGHTTRFLSDCGYNVTAVDIEEQFLGLLPRFAHPGAIPITALHGSFTDAPLPSCAFDAVVFFECFHHCLAHSQLIANVRHALKPGGKIIFCAEPFYDDWFEFPWGVRLDGHAVWAARNFGWMELGFRKTYIEQLLHRNGFSTQWSRVPDIGSYGEFLVATLDA